MSKRKKTTYKILALLLSVLMMSFTMINLQGCGSDDDDPVPVVDNGGGDTGGGDTGGDGGGGATGVTTATNVFLDGILPDTRYTFLHGSTSPDSSKFFVYVNDNDTSGKIDMYMLDTNSVTAATPALVTTGTATASVTGDGSGPQGATISFRSTWENSGRNILMAAADRFFLIDGTTLQPLNGANGDATIGGTIEGQNHDAMPTDDDLYAILTLRTKPNGSSGNTDGAIQLYDCVNKTPIGEPVSVCNSCHGDDRESVLCGLDGTITNNNDGTAPGYGGAGTPDTYSGTIYVAGHGAHFAKVTFTLDPNDTTTPFKNLSTGRINVASAGNTGYLLHDARLDGTDLYWSTYKLDRDGLIHYGKVDLANGNAVTDITYAPDVRAAGTGLAPGTGPYYCASGQTSAYHMPITMTNEAYITVIPKSTVTTSGSNVAAAKYSGTVYVAGHGAHMAKVTVNIDTASATPVTVSTSKINVASPGNTDYKLHDVRKDGDILYWSTYGIGADGNLHYGTIDLANNNAVTDNTIAPAVRGGVTSIAAGTMPYYCASGLSATAHMPISMSNEGYVTVIPKDGSATSQVYMESSLGAGGTGGANIPASYFYFHGSTSPDQSKFFMSVNDAGTPGNSNLMMFNTDSIEAGTPELNTSVSNNQATVTGDGTGAYGATITFRSNWAPGAKKIMLSGADRFYVINADTLAVENGTAGDNTVGGQNHDALSTSDSRFALLTLRTKPYEAADASNTNQDGAVQLYDVINGTPIGEPVSICNQCHNDNTIEAVLCGIDGALTRTE
ncbi:MAG: hypothetical protein KKB30_09015 [Proteobacteria bacterium]|nr:hypothetical protein [Pseudomonadota bacterium]MBU1714062.1 hypothetical protein [Pseudomonadota bacterium]